MTSAVPPPTTVSTLSPRPRVAIAIERLTRTSTVAVVPSNVVALRRAA